MKSCRWILILLASLCIVLPPTPLSAATRFVDGKDRPIDEIRVEGNDQVSTAEIIEALDMGPDDFGVAIKVMKAVLPYFISVNWNIHEEDSRRVATIEVIERKAQEGSINPKAALNRVDGLRLGTEFQISRRPTLRTTPRGELFGELSYGLSNHELNYVLGVRTRRFWNVKLSTQIHRLTDVRDRGVMPNDRAQPVMAFLYGGDFLDYYQRDGSEVSAEWQPESSNHRIRFTLLDENHDSLMKSTDWSLFRRDQVKLVNTPISPGQLRSGVLRYDFDTRASQNWTESSYDVNVDKPGWYGTLDTEHADAAFGSEFGFTRFRCHIRHERPVGKGFLAARVHLGLSDGGLPVQRQFMVGGAGTLRGYDQYEFVGQQMLLANVEYYHRMFSTWFFDMLFPKSFVIFFVDAAQLWDSDYAPLSSAPKLSVGVGMVFNAGPRLNLSQAIESGRTPRLNLRWTRTF